MENIGFLIYPGALTTGVSIGLEMLSAAQSIFHAQTRAKPAQRFWLLGSQGQDSSEAIGGLKIQTDCEFSEAPYLDLIFVPPIWGNPMSVVLREQALQLWLNQQHKKGSVLVATGSSVSLLANTGLLDGLPATTHWFFFEKFKKHFPKVNLKTQQFITYSDRIYTAGSINALSDLVLYMIEQKFGEGVAQIVEQHFSHEVSRTFEKPFFMVGSDAHHDEEIVLAQEWIALHWSDNPSLEQMANIAGLSLRTFTRRFKSAVGKTPLNYLQDVKISRSQELLRETNLSVTEVSDRAGYKDVSYFSKLFKNFTGVTPNQYRTMVRGKTFQSAES